MEITLAANSQNEKSKAILPSNYNILVVDDDLACAKMLMWTLEELGQTAYIAHDGESAIKLATSLNPAIILLDIGIPIMNGYQICQAMRLKPIFRDTIIIAQTGWGEKEHCDRSKEVGFDHHLVKPIDMKALKDVLLELDKRKSA